MQRDPDRDFVKVNKILGKQASIGFVPADQLIPWVAITLVTYLLTNGFLSLGMSWFLVLDFWLIVSWWLLTGNQPHLFLDKWRNPPGTEWCNGNAHYLSPISEHRPSHLRRLYKDSQVRVKLKPIVVPNQHTGKSILMPFQNELNLCCIVEIKKDDREVAAFLLENGGQYQLVFGFENQGIHNLLFHTEVSELSQSFEEAFKDIPPSERLTFCTGCTSDDQARQLELSQLADRCTLKPISVLVRNEQVRVQELSQSGTRQTWKQMIFATWTADVDATTHCKDPIGNSIKFFKKLGDSLLESITGNKRLHEEQFYKTLLLKGFQQGFIPWELLLTKMGIDSRLCNAHELWAWLWKRCNDGAAPPIPQLLTLQETASGLTLTETRTTDKHPATVLIEGQQGRSSCPEHRGDHDRIYLTGKGKECAVLTMSDPPMGWSSAREQLRWIWKNMAAAYVHDTEAWVEISRANNFLIQDNLARQAKSSKSAQSRAFTKGQGRDVGAEIKQDESFDAQRRLYEGARALNCAPVFLVYRNSREELNHACNLFANGFDTARIVRERHIAWEIWLQTLPITSRWLLHNSSLISERRLTVDTQSIAGFLPLTVPKPLDPKGVEFLTAQGGKPLYIDLFTGEAKRVLITGTSGSGKSLLGWRFAVDALANNIPVVGMDISSGGNSTFKTAIELLGDQGAYYDMSRGSSNLMEPPDLRKFPKEERSRRMDSWKEFIRRAITIYSMGKIHDPALAQRVDSLLLKMLEMFLQDPEIIARYNRAFSHGWKSSEWQEMPVLADLLKFCSRERLNLQSVEDIDRRAINQINSQVGALLTSRLGKAIGRPSTFSPEPAIKFFALSGLTNEQDAYLMAISAHTACIRTALSHPKSLFIGDELSVLLKRDGFAQMIGETCATGRKDGISGVFLAQDPDTICECVTGAQIMQNMNYRITGRTTATALASFQKYLGYHPSIIAPNASDAFLPQRSEVCSCWLIETNGRFWRTKFYPGAMILGSVANNQDEVAARDRILSTYPATTKGKLMGLKVFSDALVTALREGQDLKNIGDNPGQLSQLAPASSIASSEPQNVNGHRSRLAS